MSINAVMLVKDRVRLTMQAVTTFCKNTEGDWTLTILDDSENDDVMKALRPVITSQKRRLSLTAVRTVEDMSGIVGRMKDAGTVWSLSDWGTSDWLYLSDNDVYFTPGWNTKMEKVMLEAEKRAFKLLGGQNHPYHLPLSQRRGQAPLPDGMHSYLAVAGTSWLMRWPTWERFGPLEGTAKGVGQSEDTAFCNRIRDAGYRVGAMCPPVVIDTSLTTTDGRPVIGIETKVQEPGIIYE